MRQVGTGSLCGLHDLLKINRSPLVYDLAIIAAKLGHRRGKQIAVQTADDRRDRHALHPLELAIDKEETAIEILDEHGS